MAIKNIIDKILTSDFTITPKVTLPSTELSDGRLDVKNGILYIYDLTRVKWLSVTRQTLSFSRSGSTNNQYLNYAGGGLSIGTGYRLPRNATIVAISVQTSTNDSYSISVRKNGDSTDIATLSVPGTDGNNTTTTNVNLDVNDNIQCYLTYTGVSTGVYDPVVMIEIAWRA